MLTKSRIPTWSPMLLSGSLLLTPVLAHATVLTFDVDPPLANFENINQAYGDNVTATTMPGNFQYGVAGEGFTPTYQSNMVRSPPTRRCGPPAMAICRMSFLRTRMALRPCRSR